VEAKQREANALVAKARAVKKRGPVGATTKKNEKRKSSKMEDSVRQLREAQQTLNYLELGDASISAPFTSRAVSIKCCKDVIQQGRCTLVTMLQIYKILGVNCLVNALVLSKLFLHGVKQGDRQLTALGLVVTVLFYFVTRAEPLPTLATKRPPSSVLCLQAVLSITLQFAIHSTAILIATDVALSYVDPYDPSMVPDGAFNPNALNTCTFILTCLATINTFAVNYHGRPFMEDLHENKLLYRSLQASYAILFICALEAFPPLNDLLQLSPLPSLKREMVEFSYFGFWHDAARAFDFPPLLCSLMMLDTLLVFACERTVRAVLS
jgi:manganese-transporting P-type ATPase